MRMRAALLALFVVSPIAGCARTHESVDASVDARGDASSVVFRSCEAALASAVTGDACEGAFFCSSFSSDLCCSHSVECRGERVLAEDTCTCDP